ncbi:MAG: GAF domain-containing protein [Thermoflexales bacterium]|nr:GAF domain-containing protein [Thermoflexales bacterium]
MAEAVVHPDVIVLQREIAQLQLMLDITTEHADNITEELYALMERLQKRAVQLETSSQVARQVTSTLNIEQALPSMVREIQTRFDYYCVSVWLIGDRQNRITLQASSVSGQSLAFSTAYIPLDATTSVIARVGRTGQLYQVNDTSADALYMSVPELPDTRSELSLPLRVASKSIGVLDIQSRQVDAFDAESVTVLQLLADQIAIAIRNAQLYAQVVHFNEELESEVSKRTQELEGAYRNLELLDRNKSDSIQVMSHELRTPLTLIQSYSQMLLADPAIRQNDARYQEVMGIEAGASRIHNIVSSMLDMARIDSRMLSLSFRPLSLPALFDSLREDLAEALTKRKLSLSLPDMSALPLIEADRDALFKVFYNLLINAIKYTPDGGSISIAAELLNGHVNDPSERYVEIVVSDTGIGIAPETRELIFAKFYRTGKLDLHSSGKIKFKGGGPGLGLPIARGIVEAHGGRIWVESPGYDEESCPGSDFHVVLPVVQPPPESYQLKGGGG